MVIVHTRHELLARYDELEDPTDPDLMLQEYIPTCEDGQWMFNGYFDGESRCLFGMTGIKLRQTPPYTGMTSLGECAPNPEIEALTCRFMQALGYRGILDIGYRFDVRDGHYKVLDINPRLGATFRLFVDKTGWTWCARSISISPGSRWRAPAPAPRRKWVVEDLDLVSSCAITPTAKLGAGKWLRSLVRVRRGRVVRAR